MSKSTYFFTRSEHDDANPLEGKFASSHPPDEGTADGEAEPLSQFVGQYWFVELPGGKHKAMSTEEVGNTLREGRTARSISGPFSTREEADQSLERYWEMIMDNEDE
jgi:hypothetical protein